MDVSNSEQQSKVYFFSLSKAHGRTYEVGNPYSNTFLNRTLVLSGM
jgi:hypothetical protein